MSKRKENRICKPAISQPSLKGRIADPSSDKLSSYDDYHPVFCLRYLQNGYDLEVCDQRQQADFAKAMRKRSQMTWRDIWAAPRHALGAEKISRKSIKAPIPSHISEDIDFFIALRFSGRAPMVGYRIKDVFHVVWLDSKFSLYSH